MRKTKVFYWLFLITLCTSCIKTSEVNEPSIDENSQKWQLVKMTSGSTGTETTGINMAWQEYYIFNTDATFVKYRDQDGRATEAHGKYKNETLDGEEFIELTYISGSEIIANCTGTNSEFLYYRKGDVLRGIWNACDGPELEYEKLQK